MASKKDLNAREMESFVDTGSEASIAITLSATPETVTTVSIPSHSKGFRIYSGTDSGRFAVNNTVVAIAASSATTIASSVFAVGGVFVGGQWETRLLPPQNGATERTLDLYSLEISTVLTLEVF